MATGESKAAPATGHVIERLKKSCGAWWIPENTRDVVRCRACSGRKLKAWRAADWLERRKAEMQRYGFNSGGQR